MISIIPQKKANDLYKLFALNENYHMGKLLLAFIFLTTAFLFAEERTDLYDVIQPTGSIISVGIEPELDYVPNSVTTYFHFDIGATENMDINLKYGVTSHTKPYYGAHLEYHYNKNSIINLVTSTGFHYRDGTFLDITPVLAHDFKSCSIATGPEFNWKFTNNKQWMLDWFFGISFTLPKSMSVSANVGVPIYNDTYWVSLAWFANI